MNAVDALNEATRRSMYARPMSWKGTCEAIAWHHGKQFFCRAYATKIRGLKIYDSVRNILPETVLEEWEVVTQEQLECEAKQ